MNLNSDYRYSEWDNSQQVNPFDAHDLMDAISGDLLDDGDLEKVLQRLHRWGDEGKLNDRLQGMKQLMERLRTKSTGVHLRPLTRCVFRRLASALKSRANV